MFIGGGANDKDAPAGADEKLVRVALATSSVRSRAMRFCTVPRDTPSCAAIALVLTPFTPAGVPIIAASAACLIGWKR